MTRGGPLLILESRGQRSSHIQTLNFAPFRHNIIFKRMMMILDACVACDPRSTPIKFEFKVKVRLSVLTLHHFRTVNLTF